jgi:WD40 repeat protein
MFGSISAVAWDAEGRRLAFGGRHGIIRIWNADTEQLIPTPSEYALDINRIQWQRNGPRLMATSRAVVREWDTGPSLLQVIRGMSTAAFLTVRWSPDGQSLAAGNYQGTLFWNADGTPAPHPGQGGDPRLRWWEPANSTIRPDGTPAPELEGAPQRVREWAWSRTRFLACATWPDNASVDPLVRIWDERGKLVARLKGHRGGVESVDWNPAGDWLASGGGDSVRLWRPNGTSGPVMTGHTDEVYPVAWSPDGRWIASAGSDSTVRLWKPDGTPGPVLRGHQGGVHDIAWSPDSQRIASASWLDSTLRIWNVETLRTEWQVLLLDSEAPVTLSASGQPWHGDRSTLESGVSYLVERRDGATEIKSFGDFRRRHAEPFVALYAERCDKAAKESDWDQAEAAFADAATFLANGDLSIRARIQEIGDKLAQALEAAGERDRAVIVRGKASAAGNLRSEGASP